MTRRNLSQTSPAKVPKFKKQQLKVKQNKKKEPDSDLKLQQRKKGLNPW